MFINSKYEPIENKLRINIKVNKKFRENNNINIMYKNDINKDDN
jgi:hypothetical protein